MLVASKVEQALAAKGENSTGLPASRSRSALPTGRRGTSWHSCPVRN